MLLRSNFIIYLKSGVLEVVGHQISDGKLATIFKYILILVIEHW